MVTTNQEVMERFVLDDFILAMCSGKVPASLVRLLESLETAVGRDIFKIAYAIGALQPLSAIRPDVGELVMVFDKTVPVPAATTVDGKVVPGQAKLIRICAPQGKSLVVETLRALPVNMASVDNGSLLFKRANVFGFSEGFCPPGEPADGDDLGTYQNVEHFLLRPESGFDLYAENFDTANQGLVHVTARMWTAC